MFKRLIVTSPSSGNGKNGGNDSGLSGWKKSVGFFACGAGSGVITKTAVAPLERVKLLYQVQGMYGTQKYTSVPQAIRVILKEDGFRGLYKGNGANIARILPAYSLKFMFNDTYKEAFLNEGQKLSGTYLLHV